MGLLDKLTGTRPARPGVAPVPADELLTALLSLNRDTAPWQVRDGAEDTCDLVAEWRIVETAHEVRNLDEQATVEWTGGVPSVSRSWSRGQLTEVQVGEGYGYTEEGQSGQVYRYKFRSSEIRDPLREAVNEPGWGWKAIFFKP